MAIVTISHEMGSAGSTIGAAVAERLTYRFVDQGIISETARRYGVGEGQLTHLAQTRPSLLERFDGETRHYITALQSAILEVAEQDDAVIMGRSGQVLLQGISHVLRVFVRAPLEARVRRVRRKMAHEMCEEADIRTTTETVRRSDRAKYGRMRYLFDVDWRDPALYDLVISTEKLSIDAAVDLVVGVVRRSELAATRASREAVRDRAVAARVRAALAADPTTRKHPITVTASRGVVRLEGWADLERAAELTRSVPGVVAVDVQPVERPVFPPFVA